MSDELNGESPQQAGAPEGTFLSRFVWVFTSPKNLYAAVDNGVHWWEPLVWLSLINMVTAYISMPIQTQLVRLNPENVPPEQLAQRLDMVEKMWLAGMISTPVQFFVAGLIMAGISYLVLSVLSEHANFKKHLSLVLYVLCIVSIGLLMSTMVTLTKGVENIRGIEDTAASFGPEILVSSPNRVLSPILSTFDLFYIWLYVVFTFGVVHVFRVPPRSALMVTVSVWLLFVLIAVLRFASAKMAGFV